MYSSMSSMVNWEKVWEETVRETRRVTNVEYWNRRAEDYNDYIKTSDYEHGKKIREVLETEGILNSSFKVMDIAAGPGSVTIPFARVVKKVVSVEPSGEMSKRLINNVEENGLNNVEVVNKQWEEVDTGLYHKHFDLVVCCHALWHFPDVMSQVRRMMEISRGYCCIGEGIGAWGRVYDMYKRLGIDSHSFDYFIHLYNILYQNGIVANVRVIDTVMRRSIESGIRMWELVLNKYRKPTEEDKKLIRDHVMAHSKDGIYERKSKMGVIWWKVES